MVRVHTIALLMGAASPFLMGCRAASPLVEPAAPSVRRTQGAMRLPVQSSTAYHAVQAAYARRDYAAALGALDRLAAAPNVSPGEQAFLARQRLLCQKAIEAPDPATIAAPRVPAPVTAAPAADCGPRALQYVCDALRVETTVPTLAKRAGLNARGTTLAGLERAARSYGLKTEGVQMDRNALAHLRTPALAWWQGDHFVAILSVRTSPVTGQSTATIHDPNQNNEEEKPLGELLAQSGGVLLTIARP